MSDLVTSTARVVPAVLDYSSLPFPVRVHLLPPGTTRGRPRALLRPSSITIHETGNAQTGANAANHERWLHARSTQRSGTSVTAHFFVDDREAVQLVALNEVAWHAGDGATGPGNCTSIAVETCVNGDGDREITLAHVRSLVAFLLRQLHLGGPDVVVQHHHWSGKNCPKICRTDPTCWDEQLSGIARLLSETATP